MNFGPHENDTSCHCPLACGWTVLNLGSLTSSEFDVVIGGNAALTVKNTTLDLATNVDIASLPEPPAACKPLRPPPSQPHGNLLM